MSYVVRPVSDRSLFTGKHQRSQFDTPWSTTERLLLSEVRHLRGKDLVVEVDVSEMDIRIDGKIRANARPASPGVRVAFDSIHGGLAYATDRFSHWQDNVRAIALGLEALRKVDRYGITKRGEQYAGWAALPPGRGKIASHLTTDDALEVLRSISGMERTAAVTPDDLFRRARVAAHPDKHGGDRTLSDRVLAAAEALGLL